MRNQFSKPKKCELRHSVFLNILSLKRKYTNGVSGFSPQRNMNGKTQYERRGKNGRIWNPTLRLLMGHIHISALFKRCRLEMLIASLCASINGTEQARLILNTNKIQEKICAEILYIRDCRLDFFQILNGV